MVWADPPEYEKQIQQFQEDCICYYYNHLLVCAVLKTLLHPVRVWMSEIQANGPQETLRATINSWYSFSSSVCISSSSWPAFEVMHGKLTWKVKWLLSSAPDVSAFSLVFRSSEPHLCLRCISYFLCVCVLAGCRDPAAAGQHLQQCLHLWLPKLISLQQEVL